MNDEGAAVCVQDAETTGRQGNAVGRMHHGAFTVLDIDIDEIAHVVRVVDVSCGNLVTCTVRPRLSKRPRIMVTLGGTTGFAGTRFVTARCARMKSAHVVVRFRSGAGGMP